ncbi:hypothetical protein AB0C18_09510 [Nonomuraea muscovyensis]|uniref:hypothetical protein n=1 Tax=Nonomuraea muscovyensis TaxID=1124761 RepID=UPI0033DE73C3
MFKRRMAILGAVGALVLTGLAGSALADDAPGARPAAKVVCKTSDGQVIEFAQRVGAIKAEKGPDGEIVVAATEAVVGADVVRTVEGEAEAGSAHRVEIPDGKAPEKGEIVRAVPAEPATGPDGKPLVAGKADGKALPVPADAETVTCSTE